MGRPPLLLAHGGRARRLRTKRYFLTASFRPHDRWRADAERGAAGRSARRRPPRHLDRPNERRPHDRRPRPGLVDLDQPRTHVVPAAPDERADVSRDTDNQIPYNVLGNKQDEPTYRGPSNSRLANAPSRARCGTRSVAARADSPHPTRWTRTSSGPAPRFRHGRRIVVRFEENRRQFRNVEVWPDQSNGPADGLKYRFVWDAPLLISSARHNTIYTASQHVHRTDERWTVLGGHSAPT